MTGRPGARRGPRAVVSPRGVAAAGAALLLAALTLGVGAPGAAAHDYVVGTTPAADGTVTSVPTVEATFDDVVLDPQHDGSTTVLQVTDAAGLHYETSCASVLDRTISVPTALGAAGRYTVTWRIVSADGHPVSGSWAFTYRPAADVVPAPGSPSSLCTVGGGGGAESVASGPASDAVAGEGSRVSGSSGVGVGLVAGVAGVAALAVAVGVVLAVLRRRP